MLAGGRHEHAVLRISQIYGDASQPSITSSMKSFLVASSSRNNVFQSKIPWSLLPLKRVPHFTSVVCKSWFPSRTAHIFKSGPVWPYLYYLYGTSMSPLVRSVRMCICMCELEQHFFCEGSPHCNSKSVSPTKLWASPGQRLCPTHLCLTSPWQNLMLLTQPCVYSPTWLCLSSLCQGCTFLLSFKTLLNYFTPTRRRCTEKRWFLLYLCHHYT